MAERLDCVTLRSSSSDHQSESFTRPTRRSTGRDEGAETAIQPRSAAVMVMVAVKKTTAAAAATTAAVVAR